MQELLNFLSTIENIEHRSKLDEVFRWILREFPTLKPRIAWNQPVFTDHGTFIMGFSVAKNHFSVTPEQASIQYFTTEIKQAGYEQTMMLFRIRWDQAVDYSLLEKMIRHNIVDKATCTTFWRA